MVTVAAVLLAMAQVPVSVIVTTLPDAAPVVGQVPVAPVKLIVGVADDTVDPGASVTVIVF